MTDPTIVAAEIAAGGVIVGAIIASLITILSNWLQNKAEDKRLQITLIAQEARERINRQFDVKKDAYGNALILFSKHSEKHREGGGEITKEEATEVHNTIALLTLFCHREVFDKSGELIKLFTQDATSAILIQENKILAELTNLMKEDLGM